MLFRSLGALVVASLWSASTAWALSFGRLNVQSALGEPLKAEIQLSNLTPAERSSLKLRLASPQVHRAAGLEYDELLADLRVALEQQSDGGSVIQLRSERAVRNVFVDVILDVRWSSGQQLMGYTLLVSPAGTPVQPPPLSVSPVQGRQPVATESAAAVEPGAAPGAHVVRAGETLMGLAQQ